MLNTRNKLSEDDSIFTLIDSEDIKIGEKITGSYSTDIDIRNIHIIIRDIFSYNIKEESVLRKRISTLNKYIESFQGSFLRRQELIKEKIKLEETLEKFSREG
jgi:hypothetical protein